MLRLLLGLGLQKSVPAQSDGPVLTAPAQFSPSDWSVSDDQTGGDITISIGTLPDDGGSPITDLEYQIDGDGWVSLGGTTTGDYPVSGLTDDVMVGVTVRAVNVIGAGQTSANKAVTPTNPDITAPILSSPTDAATGDTTASLSVTTDEGNGTLYWVVTTSSTPPSKAQVKAGQNHLGASAAASGSQAISSVGVKNMNATGLVAATSYFSHFMHEDAESNQSNVATADGFVTGEWVTSFSQNLAGTSSTGWNGYTMRTIILAAALSEGGSKVRLSLTAGTGEGSSIDACYAGHVAAAGDAYDFDGSQVQVTVGGNGSFVIPAGQTVVTDEINIALDETRNFMVAVHFNSASNDNIGGAAAVGTVNHYYKAAVSEAGITNVSGYSAGLSNNRGVSKVEVFQS